MKIFLKPVGLHSVAMLRVVAALHRHAPKWAEIVDSPEEADLQVLHVIGPSEAPIGRRYAVIQYCGSTTTDAYTELWKAADLVWSYYDLREAMGDTPFLLAPLGIDQAFLKGFDPAATREFEIATSGYSTGPIQEAIQEVAQAVTAVGGRTFHLGPDKIEGWTGPYPPATNWVAQRGMNDETLAMLYRQCRRVSGLRQVEGFEMPVIEGASCGARPVVFDREDMRRWYSDFADFVQPCAGDELVERLLNLFAKGAPAAFTAAQLGEIRARFDWARIATAFWDALASMRKATFDVRLGETRRRLLWIGDAIGSTGFAKGTHAACDALDQVFETHVLGLNFHGDPIPGATPGTWKARTYPAVAGGDYMGLNRVKALVESIGPSVVVVQNDPWHMQEYLKRIGNVPTIGYVAVDGLNCAGTELNGLAKAIFWTKFGEDEAKKGGYVGESAVVPYGVDLEMFRPQDRMVLRREKGWARALADRGLPEDAFVVAMVGRNQWRKRFDLAIEYFAEWLRRSGVADAALWIHSAPSGNDAWDLKRIVKYYGIADRVMIPTIASTLKGAPEEALARTHAMSDVHFTATLGEGMGLPMMEAAACGVPVLAPDFSALGEIFRDAAVLVPCSSTAVHPDQMCVVGGVMDREGAINGLDALYRDKAFRAFVGERGQARMQEERFRWPLMGASMVKEVEATLRLERVEVAV